MLLAGVSPGWAMAEPLVLKPRLLLGVRDVQEQTGLGRDAVLGLMHSVPGGPVRVGRRLLVTPASLSERFEQLRGGPTG
jgi:hypothetical protein